MGGTSLIWRRCWPALALAGALLWAGAGTASEDDPELSEFVASLEGERVAAGVSTETFQRAMRGITRDPEVAERAASQPEHDLTVGAYVNRLVSEQRIAQGRERQAELADTLQAIEGRYGVDRHVLVAIWGVESSYGTAIGQRGVIRSLVTLALADGRRSRYWRRELIAALAILERGDAAAEDMIGSWAGAVGQTQFMPTTFRAHAVDFDGDGRRDLWRNPGDALASAANYLAASGWRRGEAWGFEVLLPQGFDLELAGAPGRRTAAFWRDRGLTPAGGRSWPGQASELRLILPAGAAGPAFLVGANFDAILRYNPAVSYALAVGHLADRLAGAAPIATAWPESDRALRRAEREELQRLLTAAGYDPGPVDGVLGGLTRAALRSYQKKSALPPDGHPSVGVLERLRAQQVDAPR